jgi:hypothetical protein
MLNKKLVENQDRVILPFVKDNERIQTFKIPVRE